jgi:hypothetical protein
MEKTEIFKIADYRNLDGGSIGRASLDKIFVEYNSDDDLFNLQMSSTNEITPEEASCVVSLLMEAQRIRAEYFRKNKH